ncbi:protein of unknown function [Paraburkholderia dioscoreae]|uniref:Uncharacterized protein n=1 Tax=Paraburkholderia dioscoreae TaxID=2604047 RepID=A0A5Q4YW48_9BURK|nr:protein of unknown function [Paraburkholderia dioscoreae]
MDCGSGTAYGIWFSANAALSKTARRDSHANQTKVRECGPFVMLSRLEKTEGTHSVQLNAPL